jgi:Protein of unknown function (DUF2971)
VNVREFLYRQPPDFLYHYTTQQGLLGIIKTQEIWASHTQYLNDAREFRHGIAVVEEQLNAMKKETSNQEKTALLGEMELGFRGQEGTNVCVCSFSEQKDALSQWRTYGGLQGFSIGFSGAYLRAAADELNFWLAPVIYDEDQQRTVIRALLEDVLQENLQRTATSVEFEREEPVPLGGNLGAYLNRYAPLLKHKSFSEEAEWRIISRPLSCRAERFEYRAGASMLTPYFRIPLSSDKRRLNIEEVVVGPTPHPGQSVASLRGFLLRHDLRDARVSNSQVPYRNW